MSKKDYQKIAGAIYRAGQTQTAEDCRLASPSGAQYYIAHVVENLARVLAADNPRFDRDRFLIACETGKGAK